jgi:hypothetical protein
MSKHHKDKASTNYLLDHPSTNILGREAPQPPCWTAPPEGVLLINVDAAHKPSMGKRLSGRLSAVTMAISWQPRAKSLDHAKMRKKQRRWQSWPACICASIWYYSRWLCTLTVLRLFVLLAALFQTVLEFGACMRTSPMLSQGYLDVLCNTLVESLTLWLMN